MRLLTTFLAIGFLAVTTTRVALADVIYDVTVNTTSALLTQGYIELQFNPSSFTTQSADAEVTNYSSDGVLIPPGTNANADSTGQLPGTVSMDNNNGGSDYIEELTFGTTISFQLDLSGPAIQTPDGEGGGEFILDFLNSDQSGYLFTDDPLNDVPVFTANINPDGSVTAANYASQDNGTPVVTFTEVSQVPEPSTIWLIAGGLLAIVALRRRRVV